MARLDLSQPLELDDGRPATIIKRGHNVVTLSFEGPEKRNGGRNEDLHRVQGGIMYNLEGVYCGGDRQFFYTVRNVEDPDLYTEDF